ncbi:InlB B-repeat-containing protein, partial [Methanocorpusculum sp. MG]
MSLRNYGTNRPIDTGGLLRRGVVLLASLLLVCTLMAGAVSAEDTTGTATVSTFSDLIAKLADSTTTIITLSNNIEATHEIKVNKSVTIDGAGYTISSTSQISDHLLEIEKTITGSESVTLKNLHLDSKGKAKGLNIFESSQSVILNNVELNGSSGSGITINGATVTASGLEISNSNWQQSIDVGLSSSPGVESATLTLTGSNTLNDPYQINSDNPEKVTVSASGYTAYDWYYWYTDTTIKTYGNYKRTWTTKSDFATNAKIPKDLTSTASVIVRNSSSAIPALHQDLVNATKYISDGATITLLQNVTTTETATITKKVTLDLNGYTITGPTTTPVFEMNNENAALTLKNSASTEATITGYCGANVKRGSLTVKSGVTIDSTYAGLYVYGSDTSTDQNYAVATIEKGAKVLGKDYGAVVSTSLTSNSRQGYGSLLDVSGTIIGGTESNPDESGTVGIFVYGFLYQTSGNVPQIIIRDGAEVRGYHGTSSNLGTADGQAIAGNGYAQITIYGGTFSGDEALGAPAGKWDIYGGTFTATGVNAIPPTGNPSGTETTGAAVSIVGKSSHVGNTEMTIRGGTFTSKNGYGLYSGAATGQDASGKIKNVTILGGTFISQNTSLTSAVMIDDVIVKRNGAVAIQGGRYQAQSPMLNASYVFAPFTIIEDNSYKTVAKEVPKPKATITSEPSGATSITVDTSTVEIEPSGTADDVTLNLKSGGTTTGDKITLKPVTGETLTVDSTSNSVTGNISAAVIEPALVTLPNGKDLKLSLVIPGSDDNIQNLFSTDYTLQIVNEPKSDDLPPEDKDKAVAGFSVVLTGLTLDKAPVELYVDYGSKIPQVWHAKNGVRSLVPCTYVSGKISFTASEFSSYYVTLTAAAVSSGSGNMNNAFRVLFDTSGGSYISPATGLSYGDRVAEPANPVKDGYTFGGWYKDAACTQAWSFSDSIPGDMTLYAKWTSSGTAATATQTAQTTTKATTAPAATQAQSGTSATTAAPVATTATGAQPTLTQAPAPVLGGL